MIKVPIQPEYEAFDRDVRRPGAAFLATNPEPTNREFRKHEYWSRSRSQLWEAYNRVCAYTSFHLPTDYSLDHFIPKSRHPAAAYDWSNFRLCSERVNNWKKNSLIVVDPCYISNGCLYLSFPECIIRVSNNLDQITRSRLKQTIELLRLNKDDSFVDLRYSLVSDYVNGITELDFLRRYYPFVGMEIERQGGREMLRPLF